KDLEAVVAKCESIGLRIAPKAIRALVRRLSAPSATNKEVHSDLFQITMNICWEMEEHLFLHVSPDRVQWYHSPKKGWGEVLIRWPELSTDIIECSKCFALDRFAGAIFHVLLVAEFGVIKLSGLLGEAGDKPGWGCLERLEKILQKSFKDRTPLQQE